MGFVLSRSSSVSSRPRRLLLDRTKILFHVAQEVEGKRAASQGKRRKKEKGARSRPWTDRPAFPFFFSFSLTLFQPRPPFFPHLGKKKTPGPHPHLRKHKSGIPADELLLASAADDARQASLLDSKEFAAFYDLGNILERQGDFVGALGAFTEAADLAPGLPGYRLREATSMFQVAVDSEEAGSLPASSAASFTKARRLVEGVARKNPRYAEARAALAAMHWKAGDVAAAEGALDSAVGLEGEWRKPGHAAKATRWPPRLVEAYERLLAIE